MVTGAEAAFVAVMVLFGVATTGVLAFALRDMVAEVAAIGGGSAVEDGPDAADVAEDDTEAATTAEDGAGTTTAVRDAQRVAMAGPAVYLVGFLVVAGATLFDPGPVAGVALADVGIAVIVLAAAPMAAGFYLAWRGG